MYLKEKMTKRHLLWLVAVICGLFIVCNANAEMKNPLKKKIDFEGADFFKMTAQAATPNINESSIVIAEDLFLVAEFVLKGEKSETIMKDADGNSISLENFKAGDLVTVEAAKLKDGRLVAITIQKQKQRR